MLKPVMLEIQKRSELQIIATGMHLSEKHGFTYREIEHDGFKIDKKVRMDNEEDTNSAMATGLGKGIQGMTQALVELDPDIVVVLGDRSEAFAAALTAPDVSGKVFNIGSGKSRSILDVAHLLAAAMDRPELEPEILGKARKGDIRHCFADITRAGELLGYKPTVSMADGLRELVAWGEKQEERDAFQKAETELSERGLIRK